MGSLSILGPQEARSSGLPWPDVYFTPEYGRCVQESESATWEMAVWEPTTILYPYLRRPISHSASQPLYDIVSPYGYSGPWGIKSATHSDWAAFRRNFRQACLDRGVVSEFIRFHPLLPGRRFFTDVDEELRPFRAGSTVSLDLTEGYDATWSHYEGRTRTAIRKARKLGYSSQVRPATDLDDASRRHFRFLYESTMQRVEARNYYYFPDRYYEYLWFGFPHTLLLGEVLSPQGQVVAAALFFQHGQFLHYHLAGSEREHARNGVNNLLLDSLVEWGSRQGVQRFHLGGGLSDDDPLFRFKAAFGPERHTFWLGKCVLAPNLYDRLVNEVARERKLPARSLLDSGFFPAYRTPVADPTPAKT